jgi:LDH2 family malate/lactate/ureidoglycolate dehydrogenase
LSANAVLFVLFDPAKFAGAEHFAREVGDLAANVLGSPPATPGGKIQAPGDPERRERERRSREGITLDDGTWGQLLDLAAHLGVEAPGLHPA